MTSHGNTAGGTDTYYLYYSQHLPLLGPLREVAGLLALTTFTEPVLSAIEPLLRLAVDAGYTDRVNADPSTPTQFSFITPPQKILEALVGIPAAIGQGATNLVSLGQAPTTLPNPRGNLVPLAPAPSIAPQLKDSSQARLLAAGPESSPPTGTPTSPAPTATPAPSPSSSVLPAATPSSATPSSATSAKPPTTVDPALADDGLHPKQTFDGGKVTPGDTADSATPTGGGPAPGTTTTTTTTGTNTTTTGGPGQVTGTASADAA